MNEKKYRELEELKNEDGFIEFKNRFSFQFARHWYCCGFLSGTTLRAKIDSIDEWLVPLNLEEQIDFYEGWTKNNTFCGTVYYDERERAKNYNNNNADEFIQKMFDEEKEFWIKEQEQFEEERKYVDNKLIELREQRNKLPIFEETEEVIEDIQQQIAWLIAIGVVKYLNEHTRNYSPTTTAKILSKGMSKPDEMKNDLWDNIRKALERYNKRPELFLKYDNSINANCKKYGIERIK